MSRVLAVFAVPALLAAAPAPKAPAYLPAVEGATLVYRWTYKDVIPPGPAGTVRRVEEQESEITEVVTAVKKTDAGLVITLSQKMEGSEYGGTDTFLLSEKGLFTTGTSLTGPDIKGERRWKIDPPACLLKLPHKAGNKWEYHVKAQPGGLVGGKAMKTAHGPEEVVVPAGKFMAIRVEYRATTKGKETTATFWYAPGVGLVKMVDGDTVQELKSFRPGK
jgi:hypothetical protein